MTAGSTEKEIKRAYRQLSLKFHPDKVRNESARRGPLSCSQRPQNPDPAAATYFAEFISPAYKVGDKVGMTSAADSAPHTRRSRTRPPAQISRSTGILTVPKARAGRPAMRGTSLTRHLQV